MSKDEDFWNDLENSKNVMSELNSLKEEVKSIKDSSEEIEILKEFESEMDDEEFTSSVEKLTKNVEKLKIEKLLDGEFDHNNAYLEIHSGAGETGYHERQTKCERIRRPFQG